MFVRTTSFRIVNLVLLSFSENNIHEWLQELPETIVISSWSVMAVSRSVIMAMSLAMDVRVSVFFMSLEIVRRKWKGFLEDYTTHRVRKNSKSSRIFVAAGSQATGFLRDWKALDKLRADTFFHSCSAVLRGSLATTKTLRTMIVLVFVGVELLRFAITYHVQQDFTQCCFSIRYKRRGGAKIKQRTKQWFLQASQWERIEWFECHQVYVNVITKRSHHDVSNKSNNS